MVRPISALRYSSTRYPGFGLGNVSDYQAPAAATPTAPAPVTPIGGAGAGELREGGDRGTGDESDPLGRDSDFGVAPWSGSGWDWAKTVAPFFAGPLALVSAVGQQIYGAETASGAASGPDPSLADPQGPALSGAGSSADAPGNLGRTVPSGPGPGAGPGSSAVEQPSGSGADIGGYGPGSSPGAAIGPGQSLGEVHGGNVAGPSPSPGAAPGNMGGAVSGAPGGEAGTGGDPSGGSSGGMGGEPGEGGAGSVGGDGGGGGGGAGGCVVTTALNDMGAFTDTEKRVAVDWCRRTHHDGSRRGRAWVRGYHVWGAIVAKAARRWPLFRRFVRYTTSRFVDHTTGRDRNVVGFAVHALIVTPFSYVIGVLSNDSRI